MAEYGEGKTEVLRLRVTPAEKEQFERAASRVQRTLSDWARLALLKDAEADGQPALEGREG